MLEAAQKLIEEYGMLPRGSRVLCALSGGADSVCLLHLLYTLRQPLGIRLAAAHYNHTLRGEQSDRDEAFVRSLFPRLFPDVPLVVGRGDVAAAARETGRGTEETARDMRYAFLRRAARELECTRIATAHNADDNCETLLMALLRGTGTRGLGGIPPVRDDLIRPLLTTSREEIEGYLRARGLTWVEDSTNADERYFRNRLRHRVLPVLREAAPDCDRKLAQAAARARSDEAFLQQLAADALPPIREEDGRLSLAAAPVGMQPDPVALRCARLLLTRARGGDSSCTAAHLHALVALCRSPSPSGRADLPGGLRARREYGLLILEPALPAPPCPRTALPLSGQLFWGDRLILCRQEVYTGQPQGRRDFLLRGNIPVITVRSRRTGDALAPPGRHEKSLKKWFIDEKIPAAARDCVPVFAADGKVVAVDGLGPHRAFLPDMGGPAWHITVTNR